VSKRVKFEFDERSLKTLEQLQEMGVEAVDIPPREAYFGCDGSPSERHRSHVSQQLASRDAEIARLLEENMRLRELAEAVHVLKKAADELHIKNAFNAAIYRDLDAKREAEKELFKVFQRLELP
jgi:predicted nuclease with RNAse H fold